MVSLLACGLALIAVSFVPVLFPDGNVTAFITRALALVILCQGIAGLWTLSGHTGAATIGRAIAPLLFTGLGAVLLAGGSTGLAIANHILVIGLALDGISRLPFIFLVRFKHWYAAVLTAAGELLLAAMLATEWPLSQQLHLPLCLAMILMVAGITLVRFALVVRGTPDDAAVYTSCLFDDRGWNRHAREQGISGSSAAGERVSLRILIWTPTDAASLPTRLPLINRYLMAFDRNGKPSAGHAAIELASGLYISHWPMEEISVGMRKLPGIFFAGRRNDVEGMFPPSYAWECADWTPASVVVEMPRCDEARIRTWWASWSRSTTYNVTDRNCAIAVAGALEAGLEGCLRTSRPMAVLAALFLNPAIWHAAWLRSRAEHMCWTPGLVLDYANTLCRIVEPDRSRSFRENRKAVFPAQRIRRQS